MSFHSATTINHGQTSNDADGTVTATIPGSLDDLVILGVVVNSGTNTLTCTDNGNAGNPWTRLSTAPDVLSSNTDVALFAKKLGSGDVGKTVTINSSTGGVRLPVAIAAFSGRTTVADIVQARTQETDGNTTVDPADVTPGTFSGGNWDIVEVYFTRAATAVQTTMSGVPTNHTKRAEAATNFSASPNMSVVITSRDGVTGSGTYGTGSATFSQSVNQAVEYTLALKSAIVNASPTANAGSDQTGKTVGTTVTLSGSDSDSDGTVVTRAWTQTGGTSVTLSGASTATATFTVPSVGADETLTFKYQVTDDDGATASDTCTVGILADLDDGGLRVYLVNSGGTTSEMAGYLVDGAGSLVEFADIHA